VTNRGPIRWLLFSLTAAAVILPVAVCLLAATSALLGGIGDISGRAALGWVALGVGLLWVLVLICLVLLLAFLRLAEPEGRSEHAEDEEVGP